MRISCNKIRLEKLLEEFPISYLINPANSHGNIMGAGVAGAINCLSDGMVGNSAGQYVKRNPVSVGDAYIAGTIGNCKIVHAVTMKNPGTVLDGSFLPILSKLLTNIYTVISNDVGNTEGMVAIPGLGTGIGGANVVDVAKIMVHEISKWPNLNKIEVILFDLNQKIVNAWKKLLKE